MVRVVDPEISICNPSPGVSTVTAPGDPAGNFEETESVGQSAEKATRTLPLASAVPVAQPCRGSPLQGAVAATCLRLRTDTLSPGCRARGATGRSRSRVRSATTITRVGCASASPGAQRPSAALYGQVAKKGHTEEQILRALRQAEGGSRVADICREHGISEATFYIWKKKYSGLGLSELRELRQLREANSKLKHLVADLSLDRHILQEIVQKKL